MIVLASASPRRRELLTRAGVLFTVDPADVDETVDPGLDPAVAAVLLAERKARVVAARRARDARARDAWIVGADTVVALAAEHGWRLLGKAADEEEARAMLRALSGTRHAVVTGVAVVRMPGGEVVAGAETTWVTMREIEEHEVEAYVASGEWRDKAGAYAIQETADRFVTGLEEGGFDNVVGLPVERTLRLLRRVGAPVAPA